MYTVHPAAILKFSVLLFSVTKWIILSILLKYKHVKKKISFSFVEKVLCNIFEDLQCTHDNSKMIKLEF